MGHLARQPVLSSLASQMLDYLNSSWWNLHKQTYVFVDPSNKEVWRHLAKNWPEWIESDLDQHYGFDWRAGAQNRQVWRIGEKECGKSWVLCYNRPGAPEPAVDAAPFYAFSH